MLFKENIKEKYFILSTANTHTHICSTTFILFVLCEWNERDSDKILLFNFIRFRQIYWERRLLFGWKHHLTTSKLSIAKATIYAYSKKKCIIPRSYLNSACKKKTFILDIYLFSFYEWSEACLPFWFWGIGLRPLLILVHFGAPNL